MKVLIVIGILAVVIVAGCVGQRDYSDSAQSGSAALCGNSVVDLGEECDKSECPGNSQCSSECRCELPEIPPIPE